MKMSVKIINKFLVYGLFLAGIIILFTGTGRISTPLTAFGSFIAAVIIARIFRIKGIDEDYVTYVNIGLWLNLFGELYAYYSGVLFYDKILHFSLGIILAAVVFHYYKNHSKLKKDAVFLTVLGLLALWEIYEYLLDSLTGFQSQGVFTNGIMVQSALDDTMQDLIWGSIGAWTYLLLKKEKLGEAIKRESKKIKKVRFSKFLKSFFSFTI